MTHLHLGKETVVRCADVIAVFDLDNASQSYLTREYLSRAEKAGAVINAADDLPKSFVVCPDGVYLSQLSSAALLRRSENTVFE